MKNATIRHAVTALLVLGTLAAGACQDYAQVRRAQVDLRQHLDDLKVEVLDVRKAWCEYRCEQKYENCYVHVIVLQDIPGRDPPRAPGPELPGCWPFDCESDEERERAEENPPQSCSELEEKCKADC